MKEFKLRIEMENDAARDLIAVASILQKVHARLLDGCESGKVQDSNGNSVGEFEVVELEEVK